MNAMLDETRTVRIDLNLPIARQIRTSQTIFDILSEEKPTNQTWGDFFLTAAVNQILMSHNMGGRWRHSNRLVVRLFGV